MALSDDRGQVFVDVLDQVMRDAAVPDAQRQDIFRDPRNVIRFSTAFTHESYNANHNNVVFKTLGHETLVKAIGWYFPTRYPAVFMESYATGPIGQLHMSYDRDNRFGAFLMARYPIWELIRMDQTVRQQLDDSDAVYRRMGREPASSKGTRAEVCQVVVEAFLAVIEIAMNEHYPFGVGDTLCRDMVWTWMRQIPVPSMFYQDIVDPSTVINDKFKQYVRFEKTGKRDEDGLFHCTVFYQNRQIAEGVHHLNSDEAKREAARQALKWLSAHHSDKIQVNDDWKRFHRALQAHPLR